MATAAPTATRVKWAIDPAHSEIGFKVKHLMITNVKGVFKEYNGTVYADGSDFTNADIEVHTNASSIDTSDEKRDGHLRTGEFFDVEKHKEIVFKSTSVQKGGEGYVVKGNLTINGITKPVTLDAEYGGSMKDPWGNQKHGFAVTGKINRKDWGLQWNAALEGGGFLVSDEVRVNCEIQLIKQED